MKIAGWKKTSCIDYPEKVSTIVFASGCNYKCPSCHAGQILEPKEFVNENEVFDYISETNKDKKIIDAIVVCGGEPTMHLDLAEFIEKVKGMGLLVKLDTNGSNFAVLEELNRKKLVDYIAMDVKGPSKLYPQLAGKEFLDGRDSYRKAIWQTSMFPDYEFRTTVVSVYEQGRLRWMTPKEIRNTARLIQDCTGSNEHKYFLQKFVARSKEEMLDERFSKENLEKEMHETPKELLEECLIEAKKYLPNSQIRN